MGDQNGGDQRILNKVFKRFSHVKENELGHQDVLFMVDGQFPLFPLQQTDLRVIQFDRAVHPVNEVSMVKTDRM